MKTYYYYVRWTALNNNPQNIYVGACERCSSHEITNFDDLEEISEWIRVTNDYSEDYEVLIDFYSLLRVEESNE